MELKKYLEDLIHYEGYNFQQVLDFLCDGEALDKLGFKNAREVGKNYNHYLQLLEAGLLDEHFECIR